MAIPQFSLRDQIDPLTSELEAAFARVLHSGCYVMGAEVEALEQEVASLIGARYALGVSSGTDALLLALMALDIGAGDEVIVPDFTFFATAGCVWRTGARPVFADVCPHCYNLQPEDLERCLSPKTKAIIPVHLFGQSAEMEPILAFAQKHGLRVIEDCAQSLGARTHGKATGTMGDFGATSFYPTKNLGGFGDSGMLFTNDEALYEKARILRIHGMAPVYYHSAVGANFRMDPVQAALLRVKLPHYADYCASRRRLADRYTEKLRELPGVCLPEADDCETGQVSEARIVLPVVYPHNEPIWNQYTIRVLTPAGADNQRDKLRAFLAEREIGSGIYYPVPLHKQACFSSLGDDGQHLPVSKNLAQEVLSLPLYPELKEAEVDKVIEAIASFI